MYFKAIAQNTKEPKYSKPAIPWLILSSKPLAFAEKIVEATSVTIANTNQITPGLILEINSMISTLSITEQIL